MSSAWRALGVLVAVGFSAAGVALSNLEIEVAPAEESLVRLSWRAVAERIERCRIPSEEELAALPVHMRQAEICEGRLASFHLAVAIDGKSVIDRMLRPAGAREDRPTYVLEVLTVPPGRHELEVVFSVVDEGDGEAALEPAESRAPPLQLAVVIEPAARDVVLVTRDERGALVVR